MRTFVGEVEKILEVATADGARVKATEGHPFFVEGRGFIAAGKLARGDLLRRVDGRCVAVVGLGWEETRTRVYNFEVEGTHTYYAGGVWVHNAEPCGKRLALGYREHLEEFANSVGADDYFTLWPKLSWMDYPGNVPNAKFNAQMLRHIEAADEIHFNLEGVRFDTLDDLDQFATHWELRKILESPELCNKTTLYNWDLMK